MPLTRTLALLEEGIDRGLHLGGQLVVILRGEVEADTAFGEVRPGEPMRRDHLVLWLSASKPVAAVAIAQLWERALLDLDDPVARHLPEFAAKGKESITIRHLLTHTAGIRLLGTGWPEKTWDEILAWICGHRPEPRWVPGARAGYHLTSSWFVLGELVRRLDGRPFDRYVREAIFEPLAMEDSWIGMPVPRFRAYGERIAPTFDTEREPPASHGWESELHVTRTSPGANGRGPMVELARFYEMLAAGGTLGAGRVLLPQTVEALVARHRVGLFDHTFDHVLDWGLGFVLDSRHYGDETAPYGYGRYCSPRSFGHSGYRSTVGFADPEHRLVVALGVNGTPSDDQHGHRFASVLTTLYQELGLAPERPLRKTHRGRP